MKKNSIICLLLFLFAFAGQSQKIYSVENLEQASQEDLNTYLDKALKLKKTGKYLSIGGPITAAAGFGLTAATFGEPGFGEEIVSLFLIIGVAGLIAPVVGLKLTI